MLVYSKWKKNWIIRLTNANIPGSALRMTALFDNWLYIHHSAAFTQAHSSNTKEQNKHRPVFTCRWSGEILTLYLKGVCEVVELGKTLRENCSLFPTTWHRTFCKKKIIIIKNTDKTSWPIPHTSILLITAIHWFILIKYNSCQQVRNVQAWERK